MTAAKLRAPAFESVGMSRALLECSTATVMSPTGMLSSRVLQSMCPRVTSDVPSIGSTPNTKKMSASPSAWNLARE